MNSFTNRANDVKFKRLRKCNSSEQSDDIFVFISNFIVINLLQLLFLRIFNSGVITVKSQAGIV